MHEAHQVLVQQRLPLAAEQVQFHAHRGTAPFGFDGRVLRRVVVLGVGQVDRVGTLEALVGVVHRDLRLALGQVNRAGQLPRPATLRLSVRDSQSLAIYPRL